MADKLTKQEMREDAFRDALTTVYHRIEHHVENHWRLYLMGLGLFIVAVAVSQWLFVRSQDKNDRAQYLASQVAEALSAPILKAGDPSREQYTKMGITFFESEKGRDEEIQRRIATAKAAPSGGSAKAVKLYEAIAAARSGNVDQAISLSSALSSDKEAGPLAILLEARLREAKLDAAGAEASWKKLSGLTGPGFPEGAGSALLAEYYERAGQKEKARETWAAIETSLKGKAGEDDPLMTRAQTKAKELKSAA